MMLTFSVTPECTQNDHRGGPGMVFFSQIYVDFSGQQDDPECAQNDSCWFQLDGFRQNDIDFSVLQDDPEWFWVVRADAQEGFVPAGS